MSIKAHVPQIAVGTPVHNTAIINDGVLTASNTFTIIAEIPPIPPVVPETPLIVPGYCDSNNHAVPPTLLLPQTEGIDYSVIPPTPPTAAGGNVTDAGELRQRHTRLHHLGFTASPDHATASN